jgi:hypothetical protein
MNEHLRRTESFSSCSGSQASPNPYGELSAKTLSRMFYETAEQLLSEANDDSESDASSVLDCVSKSRLNVDDFTISNARSDGPSLGPSEYSTSWSVDLDGWQSLKVPHAPTVLQTYREDASIIGHKISQIASLSGEHGASIFSVNATELAQMKEPVAIMQSAVARCLERLGLCYQPDFACDFVSSYTIDFALVSPGCDSEHVAILVDGPSHKPCFLRVRDRLLRARGWHLVRLSLDEWSRLGDQKNEDLYLSRRLKGLSRGPVYISPTRPSPNSLRSVETTSGMSASSTNWSAVTTAPLLANEPSADPIAGCKRPWNESDADNVDESRALGGRRPSATWSQLPVAT